MLHICMLCSEMAQGHAAEMRVEHTHYPAVSPWLSAPEVHNVGSVLCAYVFDSAVGNVFTSLSISAMLHRRIISKVNWCQSTSVDRSYLCTSSMHAARTFTIPLAPFVFIFLQPAVSTAAAEEPLPLRCQCAQSAC